MNYIALTSANEAAMAAVAEQLLRESGQRPFALALMVGIQDAHAAAAVFSEGGELWRIGEDDTHPELDVLIDRQICDSAPSFMARQVGAALERFLQKSQVAA